MREWNVARIAIFFENELDCPENELKDLLCTIDAIHPVIFKEVKK